MRGGSKAKARFDKAENERVFRANNPPHAAPTVVPMPPAPRLWACGTLRLVVDMEEKETTKARLLKKGYSFTSEQVSKEHYQFWVSVSVELMDEEVVPL